MASSNEIDKNSKINSSLRSPKRVKKKIKSLNIPCREISSVYKRVDSIDQGVYGSVYQGRDKETGETVALKKVKIKSGHRNGFPLTAIRENNILMKLSHPNIVNVKEVVYDKVDNGIFMVMEFMEHDLKHVMSNFMQNPFTVSEVKCLMKQLLNGLAFMHSNWILHRDLKTSNLLYDNKGHLKICDFGMAREYGDPLVAYSPNVVTLWYRSPEILLGQNIYGPSADVWSAGVVMAELLLKKGLFEGTSDIDQLQKIFEVLGTPNRAQWPGLRDLPGAKIIGGQSKKSTLRTVLSRSGRMIISEMGLTLLKGLLQYNPERRLSAEKALQHPWFEETPAIQNLKLMPTFPSRLETKKRY